MDAGKIDASGIDMPRGGHKGWGGGGKCQHGHKIKIDPQGEGAAENADADSREFDISAVRSSACENEGAARVPVNADAATRKVNPQGRARL